LSAHLVQLDALEGDPLVGKEVFDLGAERAVALGEDGDGILGDHLINDFAGLLLLPILVPDGAHLVEVS